MDRYHRQRLLPQIGDAGQARLLEASVLLVGCGALGSTIAEQLVRAGVGMLIIADRDIVELTNLQRQVLFDERDAADGLPKAVAAARRLGQINSSVKIEALVTDVHAGNIEQIAGMGTRQAIGVMVDGTDNVRTRYLMNDCAVKHAVPWVYGGCVGAEGRIMVVASPATPCLRCVFPLPPDPRTLGTCDTVGVLGPAANAIGALQAIAVIKLLCAPGQASRELLGIDFWTGRFTNVSLRDARREDCVCCSQRRFEFLDDRQAGASAVQLCGCDTVQVRPAGTGELDLDAVAKRLADAGVVRRTPYFVRCALYQPGGVVLTLFRDRRLLVQGGADVNRAKSFYARFVGE